jgi:hypothetical protein
VTAASTADKLRLGLGMLDTRELEVRLKLMVTKLEIELQLTEFGIASSATVCFGCTAPSHGQ